MNPPSYFTRSSGPVIPTTTEEAPEHMACGRPGRLAPKWLEDLLTGHLTDHPQHSEAMMSGCGENDGHHELLIIGHQSILAENSEGDKFKETLSCICHHCRYQFVIQVETPGDVPCGLPKNFHDIFHHFVWKPTPPVSDTQYTKYFPIIGQVEYQCSAPNCSTLVTVQVLRPRLAQKHIHFLLDLDSINQRKAEAVAEDPDKYGYIEPNALELLWRYICGVVAGNVAHDKKVQKQNKLFRVQLGDGPIARALLLYLEFEEESDGTAWNPPRPEITKPTPLGSQLAFYQNIKSELGALMRNQKPLPILGTLKKTLHIEEASTRAASQAYDSTDYETLGITQTTHESVFWYAFTCQRQTDPSNTAKYLEAVRKLIVGRGDEDLEMKVTTFESMQSVPQQNDEDADLKRAIELSHAEKRPVSAEEKLTIAYNHFGFDFPPSYDDLVNEFQKKCAVSAAWDRITHIEKLAVIGFFTNDAKITTYAKKQVTLDDAFSYLKELPGTDPNIIEAKAYAMESEHNEGATEGGDIPILLAAIDRISVSEPKYEPLRQTGVVINARHGSNYNNTNAPASPIEEATDVTLPVGLQNIRNTCYLNSILQYLYTVDPVREIVLDYDKYRLESITNRRIVARSLGPGDPYAGQEFVTELGNFFTELASATTRTIKPKQRLALAAFKSAEVLENDGAEMLKAPPLPPRPSETKTEGTDGLNITVTSVAADENADVNSTVSSQTLANGNSEEGYVSISRDGAAQDVSMETIDQQPQEQRRSSTDSALDLADFADVGDLPNTKQQQQQGEGDVIMTEAPVRDANTEEKPAVPEPTREEKIARGLDDDRVTGTAQEDVSEVIGTVINHLHAAIKPTGTDPVTETQEDVLTDTFYWTGVSTKKQRSTDGSKKSTSTRTLYKERTMTAYPDENKTISLIEALDRTFGREYIADSNLELYQSIVKLPPVLHIQIQRTKADSGKINTPIDIPQVLCLDRYMDADNNSELFKKRNRSWNIAEKLQSQSPNPEPEPDLAAYRTATIEEYMRDDPEDDITIISPGLTNLLDKYGIAQPAAEDVDMEDKDTVDAAARTLSNKPTLIADFETKSAASAEALRSGLIEEHAKLFDGLEKHKYLLHAVICHQGITGKSGHYWIYIYDFKKQLWRKYNDTRVEVMETDKVMETLKANGEPYYLAYVRAENTDIVNIPLRAVADSAPENQPQALPDYPTEIELTDQDQDQDMPDLVDAAGMFPQPPSYPTEPATRN